MTQQGFHLDAEENERYMKRFAQIGGGIISAADLGAAAEKALAPALGALQAQTLTVGVKTGRLRKAPGVKMVKKMQHGFASVFAAVGYRSGVAPHDWYVEFGTRPRRGRGIMPPFFLTQKAFSQSGAAVASVMESEMQTLAEAAVKKLAG